jgi:hypothetical protein
MALQAKFVSLYAYAVLRGVALVCVSMAPPRICLELLMALLFDITQENHPCMHMRQRVEERHRRPTRVKREGSLTTLALRLAENNATKYLSVQRDWI